MTIYHFGMFLLGNTVYLPNSMCDSLFLFSAFSKFKSTISDEQKATAFETAHQLAAHIPGVKYFKAGPPVETTYTQGYGFGEHHFDCSSLGHE